MTQKTFSINEIKNYLMSKDSFGDAIYFLNEENIIAANKVITEPEEWLKTNYNKKVGDVIENGKYIGRKIIDVLKADNKGHFRTNYPVVILFHSRNDDDEINKVTIEEIFGY